MEKIIKVVSGGSPGIHVGIPVCEGPGTYRLLLTWPEQEEGRILEIPQEDIMWIGAAKTRARGKRPRIGSRHFRTSPI